VFWAGRGGAGERGRAFVGTETVGLEWRAKSGGRGLGVAVRGSQSGGRSTGGAVGVLPFGSVRRPAGCGRTSSGAVGALRRLRCAARPEVRRGTRCARDARSAQTRRGNPDVERACARDLGPALLAAPEIGPAAPRWPPHYCMPGMVFPSPLGGEGLGRGASLLPPGGRKGGCRCPCPSVGRPAAPKPDRRFKARAQHAWQSECTCDPEGVAYTRTEVKKKRAPEGAR
jgi:hypothetical protein